MKNACPGKDEPWTFLVWNAKRFKPYGLSFRGKNVIFLPGFGRAGCAPPRASPSLQRQNALGQGQAPPTKNAIKKVFQQSIFPTINSVRHHTISFLAQQASNIKMVPYTTWRYAPCSRAKTERRGIRHEANMPVSLSNLFLGWRKRSHPPCITFRCRF